MPSGRRSVTAAAPPRPRPPKDPSRDVPWVVGGPLGLNTGVNIRYRIIRNFGLILSPEVDLFLPDLLLNLELSIGAEAAF